MRTFVAFLVAPLLPALAPAWFLHKNNPDRLFISGFIFLCGLFYLLEAVIGIPAHKLFLRKGWNRVWTYMLLGLFGVTIPFVAFALYRWSEKDSVAQFSLSALYLGLLGVFTGLIFWFIARPKQKPI
jgi:hypothetical protein